jgi:imidazolonepropionase-like amidohydrolase
MSPGPGWIRSCAALAITLGAPGPARAQQADSILERGVFTLHKFKQPIGSETYSVSRSGDTLVLADSFAFTDRGTRVPLAATLVVQADLTPVRFEIHGQVSRQSSIDAMVSLSADSAVVRSDSVSRSLARPPAVFAISGYAPVAIQEALVRYWKRHGRPDTLPVLPAGRVMITRRGVDTVTATGGGVVLDRYSIAGLIWGRETLWLDPDDRLIALVSVDAEFDHFEAVREGWEDGLATFVSRAGADAGLALAELARGAEPPDRASFALVGATLIDGTGAPPVRGATVVVDGDRIRAAGSRVRVPPGIPVIDARGKTVLPGLWDMHAHYEQVEWGPIYLAAGVTTARDVGNEFEFITAVRDAIRAGRGIGPRLLLAGIVDGSSPNAVGVDRADTPEEAVAIVRRYRAAGFLQMKIYSSVSPEVVRAVASEAHRLGMTVTGHVPQGMDAYQAVEAGMDQINHISYIRQVMLAPSPVEARPPAAPDPVVNLQGPEAARALNFLRAHHTVVDPTVALFEWLLHPRSRPFDQLEPGVLKVAPELRGALLDAGVPDADSARAGARLRDFLSIIGALHRAGIPIVAGTDQTVPGWSLHRELELYVQAGFTPLEAIQAATIVPARVMHLEREVGTISPGKRADLLVVEGDPLRRFSDLRRVWLVVADGRRYDPAALWRSVGFTP